MKGQPISVSKAKKAIADYKKAIGRPAGMAELSIFYCEEAFGFLESCSMEDESLRRRQAAAGSGIRIRSVFGSKRTWHPDRRQRTCSD
jgi:hypothetical protein